mmetsp:Transcript_26755/g.26995  ORF Transcript_26755/g.26995 Transcript_26755/m.26995 type:complete len:805 (-) Transcript_26755:241-2655(-)
MKKRGIKSEKAHPSPDHGVLSLIFEKRQHSRRLLLLLVLLGSLINLVPFLCNQVTEDIYPFVQYLKGKELFGSLVASVAITFPVIVDLLLDFIQNRNKVKFTSTVSSKADREMFFVVSGGDACLLIFLQLEMYGAMAALLKFRASLLVYMLARHIHKLTPTYMTFNSEAFICLCFLTCNAVESFTFVTDNVWIRENVIYIYYSLIGIAFIELIRIYSRWIISYKRRSQIFSPQHNAMCNIYLSFYAIFIFFDWIFPVFVPVIYEDPQWSLLGVHSVSTNVLVMTFGIVGINVLSMRLARNCHMNTKQTLAARKAFVNYISHEIRTPLNVVLSGVTVLEKNLEHGEYMTADDRLDTLHDIRNACDIAVDLLSEMLTYDKIESKNMTLEMNEFHVKDFIKECIRPFYMQATANDITLTLTFAPPTDDDELVIYADKHKLSQVMRNLLSNAMKFTPSKGDVSLKVSCVTDDNSKRIKEGLQYTLKVEVIDTGAGISQDNQEKLFKSVVQFNPGKLQAGGGTGLGLYISKGIVDLHDGNLLVYSAGEGLGTTFTLTIPRVSPLPHMLNAIDTCGTPGSRDNRVVPVDNNSEFLDIPSHCAVYNVSSRRSVDRSSFYVQKGSHFSDDLCVYTCNSNDSFNNKVEESEEKPTVITLPCESLTRQSRKTELPNWISSDADSSNQSYRSQCNVLIVDDSAANRKMLMRLMKNHCGSCEGVADGVEAVSKVKSSMQGDDPPIDVILMDNHMTHMDGPVAAKALRNMGYQGLIIGLSGDAEVDSFMSSGADKVLIKPLNIDEYDSIVRGRYEML